MVEVAFTYDFLPNIDENAYAKIARQATKLMADSDGFIEFRAHRNLVGSPHVRRTSVWKSLAHWAALAQREDFQKLSADFRLYVTNLEVHFWGPSPIIPKPLRPGDI